VGFSNAQHDREAHQAEQRVVETAKQDIATRASHEEDIPPLARVDSTLVKPSPRLQGPQVVNFNPVGVTTDTNPYIFTIDFTPNYWLVVARLTAGAIMAYPGRGPGGVGFRLALSTQIRIPFKNDAMTILTQAATGTFDLYAIYDPNHEMDSFSIGS
jgi:hypothetical protein